MELSDVGVNTVRQNPIRADIEKYVTIPLDFYKLHKCVMPTADVFLLTYLHSLSHHQEKSSLWVSIIYQVIQHIISVKV